MLSDLCSKLFSVMASYCLYKPVEKANPVCYNGLLIFYRVSSALYVVEGLGVCNLQFDKIRRE